MSNDSHVLMMQEAALEWGVSAARSTLSSIEQANPCAGIQPYLLDLDRSVAARAAALLDEGLDETLAAFWESAAREAIDACLAVHDEDGTAVK